MRTQFIQIEDIAEIDTSKINVYDMNKRYVDKSGNMYGLRYNHNAKKIEIIKILRTTARNQQFYEHKINSNKKLSGEITDEIVENYDDSMAPLPKSDASGPADFNSEVFISKMFSALTVYRERINVIVKNISNVPMIPREQRDLNIKLDELLRGLDIDGLQRMEKIQNTYREMTDYPRSVNYYLAKLDARSRSHLSKVPGDESKLKFIIANESCNSLREIFYYLSKCLSSLNQFIDENKDARHIRLNAQEKQSLSDASTTITTMVNDLQDRIVSVNEFEHQLFQTRYY
jgi:hypothetical protein